MTPRIGKNEALALLAPDDERQSKIRDAFREALNEGCGIADIYCGGDSLDYLDDAMADSLIYRGRNGNPEEIVSRLLSNHFDLWSDDTNRITPERLENAKRGAIGAFWHAIYKMIE